MVWWWASIKYNNNNNINNNNINNNALLIIDILPLVVTWEMPMGTLTYSMRASSECWKNVARNGITVYEMLYIRTIRPNLNTQSDSIWAKLLFNFQFFFIYSSLHFIYSISYILLSLVKAPFHCFEQVIIFNNATKCSVEWKNRSLLRSLRWSSMSLFCK